ncbi:helix-hairpin-helix domain-containing protein [Candidatus Dojkabacteria bacterium]|nr:helix-hairpin-helix domain-containing protein [Candidatus Dojkabacteria bacterium]
MPHKLKPIYIYSIVFLFGVAFGYGLGYFFPIDSIFDTRKEKVTLDISDIGQEGEESVKGIAKEEVCTFPVEVAGAVNKPGVYCFTDQSIISEALDASGGLNRLAASRYVSQRINLAEKLTGNQKLYFPFEDDLKCEHVPFVADLKLDDYIDSEGEKGCVSLNNATQKELEDLNGIGEVSAKKIMASRPYSKAEEVKSRAGISDKLFEQIKDAICL